MGLTILPPDAEDDQPTLPTSYSSQSDDSLPSASDDEITRPAKRLKLTSHRSRQIAIPGETITDETQWMRGHGTFIPQPTHLSTTTTITTPPPTIILSTTLGPLTRTNKLLTIPPLRARYTPEIGDLIIGRIVSVSKNRWTVDIGAPLLAQLPLSSINLPGGILRRKTTSDELQMRAYFQEGDVLVAEVQAVGSSDGTASLHARSLRYGKLRNGVFWSVSGVGGGGGGGVVRARRQVFSVNAGMGGSGSGGVDVILGVNGYIWVSKHVEGGEERGKGGGVSVSVSNLDDAVGREIYSSQNDEIDEGTRREIGRVGECIKVLSEGGIRVDEDSVVKAYEVSVDYDMGRMEEEEGSGMVMTLEARQRIVEAVR